MTWIKICGMKDIESVETAVQAGVDAIGLNFYSKSPRFVDIALAEQISKSFHSQVLTVGLFVNHTHDDVVEIVHKCELEAVQFHGDETPEFLSEIQESLPEVKIIKAWRMKGNDLSELGNYLKQCNVLDVKLFACLVDAYSESAYGGTGKTVHWPELNQQYDRDHWPPLILAGGLTPKNISEAVKQVEPWGVDTASGVETSPGIKDPHLIRIFVSEIR